MYSSFIVIKFSQIRETQLENLLTSSSSIDQGLNTIYYTIKFSTLPRSH